LVVVASITHTTLNLLTSEGTVAVFIVPGLTPEQYSDLHELVLEAQTAAELRDAITAACDRWGREVHFD
jgi:hypothetical protein